MIHSIDKTNKKKISFIGLRIIERCLKHTISRNNKISRCIIKLKKKKKVWLTRVLTKRKRQQIQILIIYEIFQNT